MSRLNLNSWAIFPLLSILSLSPAQMETKNAERFLASIVESKTPRFDKLTSKVDKSVASKDVSYDQFIVKVASITETLKKERESFKKNLDKKEEVLLQRKTLEAFVSKVVLLEEDLSLLKEKKLFNPEQEELSAKKISEFKSQTEGLLGDLDLNEDLVAKAEKPVVAEVKKEEPLPELPKVEKPAVVAEVKKEEPLPELPKAEDKTPNVIVEEAKIEPKTEEVKKEVAKKECTENKEKVLTPPAEKLVVDQSMIMQQMMTMNQMIMLMLQQLQISQMQHHLPNQGPVNQQAYQYLAPTNGGNWVFQPSGASRPGGMYPDQFSTPYSQMPQYQPQQGYNGWGMQPQNYDLSTPMTPGQFGGPALGFNMSSPMVGPAPMPYAQPPMGPMGSQSLFM
ncbi:MAG TPA: hypothetical protein VNJ08_07725 [Bacteriovoracaceae bacterium]|nr:hypothetical protein [Bacteriovoracaceae bacterium]